MSASQRRVVVVGGGIAGLVVAFELRRLSARAPGGIDVVCVEGASGPGGNIRTVRADGYVCEWGPNGFLDNAPATLELVRRVGLEERLAPADPQSAIRWIYRRGRLRKVPDGPGSFLLSDVLSWRGKLRLLAEPFARGRPAGVDESVFAFAARRIGPEAARVLVGAMVTGVYAGDAAELSLQATFPKMHAMESEHGGLFRAMRAKARAARRRGASAGGGPAGPGGHLTSFRDGFEELPAAVAAALGSSFRSGSPATRVVRDTPWRVELEGGEALAADAVVLACPAWHAAALTRELDRELGSALDAIPSAALAVLHLGFDHADLPRRPVGFGFLVPRGEGPRILGALYGSNIFPGRSPAGQALITVMVGGAHEPDALELDDDGLLGIARADLRATLGIEAEPTFRRIFRHPRGIPQYTVGHLGRVATIERLLARHPGLFVHGNSYRGISVNLCVEQSPRVAEAVLAALGGHGP